MESKLVVPGERLGSARLLTPGNGTYVRNGFIYAKLCGVRKVKDGATEDDKAIVTVFREGATQSVPDLNAVVTCRVVSSNPRGSKVLIVGVNGAHLKDQFKGVIRKEDVRATEKDRVKIHESFRPGDVVLARVISLGDAQFYFLSTAENELGVIYALSEFGSPMLPISWCQMQCTKTGVVELRKVAKVKVREI